MWCSNVLSAISHGKMKLNFIKTCKNKTKLACFSFKIVCLIELTSKFMKEKTAIFIFLVYLVFPACISY